MAVKATGASGPNLAIAGCHDSTLAAVLASLGALEGENAKWPPFTSSLAMVLFRAEVDTPVSPQKQEEQGPSSPWLYKPSGPSDSDASADLPPTNPSNKINLSNPAHTTAYVRLRYNDRPVSIPGCALPGNHLPSDPTFCTFVSTPLHFPTSLPQALTSHALL